MPLKEPKVALIGNPNAGKSSLFNHLTGLNQKIGNFPGVTVDKKTGTCKISDRIQARIIDLPGIYSLYPKSPDEQIVFDFLNNSTDENYPDFLLVVVDASNLKRNLLLFTQIRDLGFPVILALNMLDIAEGAGIDISLEKLQQELNVPVVAINARTGEGIEQIKAAIACPIHNIPSDFLNIKEFENGILDEIKEKAGVKNDYFALQLAHQFKTMRSLPDEKKKVIQDIVEKRGFESRRVQSRETIKRYERIHDIITTVQHEKKGRSVSSISTKIDKIVTHKYYGYLIYFFILFLIFQAIFSWASLPMDLIDASVAGVSEYLKDKLPVGPLSSLLTDGLIPGLGGILIFIPQIALLFVFISLLEETGYMARVMFLMDKLMRKFGMSGKSVVPLISGVACAVPAIMATRSIENRKERLITIFVTPLMSCSARLPVFAILIALIIPDKAILGLNIQGIALMVLYLLGFFAAIFTGLILNKILKKDQRSFFIMEFPSYRLPRWKNLGITIVEKVKAFVFEAGKIILAISIILWVLSSYGPGNQMEVAEKQAIQENQGKPDMEALVSSVKLEHSYAGKFGKFIEPAIKPLGFDWKIGIALITSFAAREVFIGTMSTIYSIAEVDESYSTIKDRMKAEINPDTGKPMYSFALGCSLLIFYAFAMQCMSTLAIVYRETNGWKWPAIQLLYMTGLAYLSSFCLFQLLS